MQLYGNAFSVLLVCRESSSISLQKNIEIVSFRKEIVYFWYTMFNKVLYVWLWTVYLFLAISRKGLFKRIKSLQCYELTLRCSHLPSDTNFIIDLCSLPMIFPLWMCTDTKMTTDFNSLHFGIRSGYVLFWMWQVHSNLEGRWSIVKRKQQIPINVALIALSKSLNLNECF